MGPAGRADLELGWRIQADARRPLPAHLRAPGNTAQHWIGDTTRIREELGCRETLTREEAIRRTIEWERDNPPTGFTPYQIDYRSEDEALRNAS